MKAQVCPMCNGQKWVYPQNSMAADLTTLQCEVCRGKGIVYIPETPEEFAMVMDYMPTFTVYSDKTSETKD